MGIRRKTKRNHSCREDKENRFAVLSYRPTVLCRHRIEIKRIRTRIYRKTQLLCQCSRQINTFRKGQSYNRAFDLQKHEPNGRSMGPSRNINTNGYRHIQQHKNQRNTETASYSRTNHHLYRKSGNRIPRQTSKEKGNNQWLLKISHKRQTQQKQRTGQYLLYSLCVCDAVERAKSNRNSCDVICRNRFAGI